MLLDLTTKTNYPDLEIIVIDNGTTDSRVLDLYAKMKEGLSTPSCRSRHIFRWPVPFQHEIKPSKFNFARQTNRGIELASGEFSSHA